MARRRSKKRWIVIAFICMAIIFLAICTLGLYLLFRPVPQVDTDWLTVKEKETKSGQGRWRMERIRNLLQQTGSTVMSAVYMVLVPFGYVARVFHIRRAQPAVAQGSATIYEPAFLGTSTAEMRRGPKPGGDPNLNFDVPKKVSAQEIVRQLKLSEETQYHIRIWKNGQYAVIPTPSSQENQQAFEHEGWQFVDPVCFGSRTSRFGKLLRRGLRKIFRRAVYPPPREYILIARRLTESNKNEKLARPHAVFVNGKKNGSVRNGESQLPQPSRAVPASTQAAAKGGFPPSQAGDATATVTTTAQEAPPTVPAGPAPDQTGAPQPESPPQGETRPVTGSPVPQPPDDLDDLLAPFVERRKPKSWFEKLLQRRRVRARQKRRAAERAIKHAIDQHQVDQAASTARATTTKGRRMKPLTIGQPTRSVDATVVSTTTPGASGTTSPPPAASTASAMATTSGGQGSSPPGPHPRIFDGGPPRRPGRGSFTSFLGKLVLLLVLLGLVVYVLLWIPDGLSRAHARWGILSPVTRFVKAVRTYEIPATQPTSVATTQPAVATTNPAITPELIKAALWSRPSPTTEPSTDAEGVTYAPLNLPVDPAQPYFLVVYLLNPDDTTPGAVWLKNIYLVRGQAAETKAEIHYQQGFNLTASNLHIDQNVYVTRHPGESVTIAPDASGTLKTVKAGPTTAVNVGLGTTIFGGFKGDEKDGPSGLFFNAHKFAVFSVDPSTHPVLTSEFINSLMGKLDVKATPPPTRPSADVGVSAPTVSVVPSSPSAPATPSSGSPAAGGGTTITSEKKEITIKEEVHDEKPRGRYWFNTSGVEKH